MGNEEIQNGKTVIPFVQIQWKLNSVVEKTWIWFQSFTFYVFTCIFALDIMI